MAQITITRAELEEYQRLNSERLELDRKSRTLESRCKQIELKAFEQLKAAGKQSAKRFGFVLAIERGQARVEWKGAFIKEVGSEKASQLQAAAVGKEKCGITPPAAQNE